MTVRNEPEGQSAGLSLVGQKVLVVGSGKMARATARQAIADGAEVVVSSRVGGRLDDLAAELPGLSVVIADPEDPAEATALLERVGPIDHLVVFAGGAAVSGARGIADTPADEAKRSFARFWLSYNLLHAAVGRIAAGGSVLLLSGSSSRRPSDGRGFWGTLHGSLEALGRNAAYELAPIRVNVISPGGIGVVPANRQLIEHPGSAGDVAAMAVALLRNPAVTATVVDVDGGEFLGSVDR